MSETDIALSHSVVGRTPSPLGHDPVDILTGILNVTRFAMYAVLSINLQPHPVPILLWDIFVHPGGAKPLLGAVINRQVPIDRYGIIPEG